ncbi:YtxH domain-containing protein [uncultured Alistipes sp.]|uniref:YtxH domain-containing protein n=1 Tax=uncultured Alistipes sp. TaxID=538949 RepID=UPI0026127BD1|nr:YtxH domain-containing protein [uncultured Alistipes sp.]
MKNTGIAIVSLVGGLIIGSALTMLFTPQSGPELRRKIKDSIDDEIERVKNKLNEVEEQIEEARCRCEEK